MAYQLVPMAILFSALFVLGITIALMGVNRNEVGTTMTGAVMTNIAWPVAIIHWVVFGVIALIDYIKA